MILYGLPNAELPYDVTDRPIPSATRMFRESEPARPSTIDRKPDGDIEVIAMTAMEKDRSRRYESAGVPAADEQRDLHHKPIVKSVLGSPGGQALSFRHYGEGPVNARWNAAKSCKSVS